jgi:hypothetical protein
LTIGKDKLKYETLFHNTESLQGDFIYGLDSEQSSILWNNSRIAESNPAVVIFKEDYDYEA